MMTYIPAVDQSFNGQCHHGGLMMNSSIGQVYDLLSSLNTTDRTIQVEFESKDYIHKINSTDLIPIHVF